MALSTPAVPSQKLLRSAEGMANGLAVHGPWLGLNGIPVEQFRSQMQQLEAAEAKFRDAREAKLMAAKRAAVADKALQTWLTKARLVVMLARGPRWSDVWNNTGFANSRACVPKRSEARIELARNLITFFARHPEFGVAFADVTAARGRTIYERFVQNIEFQQVMTQDCRAAREQRDGAECALREMMRQIVAGLNQNIERTDARWTAFGLKPRKSRLRGVSRFPCREGLASAALSFRSRGRAEPRKVAAA